MSDRTQQGPDGRDDQFNKAAKERLCGKTGNVAVSCTSSAGEDVANYMFEDPHVFAGIITKWNNERHSMGQDRSRLQVAAGEAAAPAPDAISVGYFNTLLSVLQQFIEHNEAMDNYTMKYAGKLAASHKSNGHLDESNAVWLRNIHTR